MGLNLERRGKLQRGVACKEAAAALECAEGKGN